MIFKTLIEKDRGWSPFADESMHHYQQLINHEKLSTATVQAAIKNLCEKGFIWQSGRGSYALEDESFAHWFRYRFKLTEN